MVLLMLFTIASLVYGTWHVLEFVDHLRFGEDIPRNQRWNWLIGLAGCVWGASTFARRLLAYRHPEAERSSVEEP